MVDPNPDARAPIIHRRKSIRHWFQFSISTSLILMTLCAIFLGTVGRRAFEAKQRYESTRAMLELKCQVQFEPDNSFIVGPLRYILGEENFNWDKVNSISSRGTRLSDDDLKHLTKFPELRMLDLSNSTIGDLGAQHLAQLSSLENVNLSGTRISTINFTERMKGLSSLDVSNTQVSDVSGLLHNPRLSELHLALTKIGGHDLATISKLKNLVELDISYAKVGDQDLEHLQGMALIKLVLLGVNVSDAGMKSLAHMDELQHLDLSYAAITGEGLFALGPRETIKTLLLEDTNIDDAGLAVVGRFIGLHELSLEGLRISDEGLAYLQDLTHLTRLDLEGTKINGSGLRHLKRLQSLESINLYNVPVMDNGLKYLQDLPNLRSVEIWNSRASQAMIDSLPRSQLGIPAQSFQAPPTTGVLLLPRR